MKHWLLVAGLSLSALSAYSQTSVETAIDLQNGENTYTFEEAGYQTVYYKFTAPADQSQLLTLEKTWQSVSLQVSTDGTYNTAIQGVMLNNGLKSVFPIAQGATVIVSASVYDTQNVSFTAANEACRIDAGSVCTDPVTVVAGKETFVPSYYDRTTYEQKPTYIAYEATESGVLEMSFATYLSSATVSEGCDGTPATVNFSSVPPTYSAYVGKHAVEEGKTYIIQTQLSSPTMATFTLTHPTEGSSCDVPFVASLTDENLLPKAAGKYWYQLMPDAEGYVALTSESALPGGTVSLYAACSDYQARASVTGHLLLRFAVQAGQPVLLCIDKTEATTDDEHFSLKAEEAQPGDRFDLPAELAEGENRVPLYNGSYYYALTVPEGGGKMLHIDASQAGILNSATGMQLFNQANPYTPIANGTTALTAELQGGKTYVLCWNCQEGRNNFAFNVTLEDIAQGDVISNPLPAVVGENSLAESAVKYYSYTATQNGWLEIETEPFISVTFPRDESGYSYYDAEKTGMITRIQAQKDVRYLIKLSDITESSYFVLTETAYQQGESVDNPIPVENEVINLPEQSMNRWYLYETSKSGKLTVTSDLIFERSADYSKTTMVSVRINDGYLQPIATYGGTEGSETIFRGTFNVVEGDKVYINVISLSAQPEKTVKLELVDFKPGESSSLPIPLMAGEVTVPESSRQTPTWYVVDLKAGSFSVSSKSSSDFFDAQLFAADDLNQPKAFSSYKFDPETNMGKYELVYDCPETAEGQYLLCVQQTSPGGVVLDVMGDNIVTGVAQTAASDKAFSLQNGVLSVSGGMQVVVYTLDGRKYFEGNGACAIRLPKGLYVVNGQKVVVK